MPLTPAPREACRVCGASAPYVFTRPVLSRQVRYFECERCNYLQTERPDWLDAAYSRAINDVDTGIMMRNRLNVGRVVMTLLSCGRLRGRVVDHAGGYGILVRLLRDAGIDAYWRDKFCENLLARGFEAKVGPFDLVTAFEVFEHLVNPLAELRALLDDAPVVLLSTELADGATGDITEWWYLGPEHGQHIGFFRLETLQWMASAVGCHLASDGRSVHVFSRDAIGPTWRPLVRAHMLWRPVARLLLSSRVQSDFDALRSMPPESKR